MMLLGVILAAGVASQGGVNCPYPGQGETQEDCPWAAFSRRLIKEADAGQAIAPLFEMLAPEISAQLKSDAKQPKLEALWDYALNLDPTSGEKIVDPRLLVLFGQQMGIPTNQLATSNVVHAGLQQTYGHLFSLAPSPNGFRRARWVNGVIESGFGLPAGLFGPIPRAGTLFRNATYFFGRLALTDSEEAMAVLEHTEGVPEALRTFAYDAVAIRRLEERVQVPQVTGREILLRTDLIAFTATGAHSQVLAIYSLYDPGEGLPKLVAGLPIGREDAEALLAADTLGDDQVINSRFEAFIEGLTGTKMPLAGSRRILSVH